MLPLLPSRQKPRSRRTQLLLLERINDVVQTAAAIRTAQVSTLAAAVRKLLKKPHLCVNEALRFDLISEFLGTVPVLYDQYHSGSAGGSILETLDADTARKQALHIGLQESKKIMSYFLGIVEIAMKRGDFCANMTPEIVQLCPTMWPLMADCTHVWRGMLKRGFQIEKYLLDDECADTVYEDLRKMDQQVHDDLEQIGPELIQPPFVVRWSKIPPATAGTWYPKHSQTPVA
mmetsp:Transcript_2219/g.5261  ORF Transcript_2219/g.5261 Transcript_2219/m.5261 type:complete len:232 (-) Transcript_2219:167-862(-)|eukprot:g6980.t1